MKTLLVDDHTLFREGLALLITQGFPQLQLLQAGDIAQAMRQLEAHPDIELLLLDLALPDSAGTSGLIHLHGHAPQVTIVVLSADETPETVLAAIDAGAAGFIPKTARSGVMQQALQTVLAGGVYLPPAVLLDGGLAIHDERDADVSAAFIAPAPDADAVTGLTPRQCDVLRLLIEGKPNKLICRELELSESTVKTHLGSIFRRLGASSRTQAVVAAARLGLRLGPVAPG
ncbi:MAG TPA: response regulator transcription factor [Burkholderiaceae bacterium]|jgi:DNA-binding NarL/FixJ family response regulator